MNLKKINLKGHKIDDRALGYLKKHRELTFIGLFECVISDRGLKYLSGFPKLRSLQLPIGAKAKITCEGLKKYLLNLKQPLQALSLSAEEGVLTGSPLDRKLKELRKMLQAHEKLKEIDLCWNTVDLIQAL